MRIRPKLAYGNINRIKTRESALVKARTPFQGREGREHIPEMLLPGKEEDVREIRYPGKRECGIATTEGEMFEGSGKKTGRQLQTEG